MQLIFDIGNTNIVIAIYKKSKIIDTWRIATVLNRTADEYCGYFKIFFSEYKSFDEIIIGSVVPDVTNNIKLACKKSLTNKVYIANDDFKINFPSKVDNSNEIGADRLVNALSAWHEFNKSAIVVDFGTATTFDVISNSGIYLGGVIAPGINLSLEALNNAAARLPRIAISKPRKVIGSNTVGAMNSGIFWGYVGLINTVINKIQVELNYDTIKIATGGLAQFFSKEMGKDVIIRENLTIDGLYLAYNYYNEKKNEK